MKKQLLSIILVLFTTITLYACNSVGNLRSEGNGVKQVNDSLSIAIYGYTEVGLNSWDSKLKDFASQYEPPLKIDIYSAEEYNVEEKQKFTSEIMGGGGVDVIFVEPYTFNDVNKTMKSGAFIDLNELIKKDNSFNPDKYYMNVLNAAKFEDKQYVLPISFGVSTIITTKQMLAQTNTEADDFATVTKLVNRLNEINNDKSFLINAVYPFQYTQFSSIFVFDDYVDYTNGAVNINTSELAEFCKEAKNIETLNNLDLFYTSSAEMGAKRLEQKEVFGIMSGSFLDTLTIANISKMVKNPQDLAVFPIRDKKGGLAADINMSVAINASSENVSVAYDFIKEIIDSRMPLDANVSKATNESLFSNLYNVNRIDNAIIKKLYTTVDYMYDEINRCNFKSNSASEVITKNLKPYFNDQATLESCLETAQSAMEIYISE